MTAITLITLRPTSLDYSTLPYNASHYTQYTTANATAIATTPTVPHHKYNSAALQLLYSYSRTPPYYTQQLLVR